MTLKMHQRRWPGRKAHNILHNRTESHETRASRAATPQPPQPPQHRCTAHAHRRPPYEPPTPTYGMRRRDGISGALRTHDLSRAHHGPSTESGDRGPPSAVREQLSSVLSMHSPARCSRRVVVARTPEEPEPLSGRPVVCPCAVAVFRSVPCLVRVFLSVQREPRASAQLTS